MLFDKIEAESAVAQHELFIKNKPETRGEILTFIGAGDSDVYNPSIPFESDGMTVIAGRVEDRSNEVSKTMFFKKNGEQYELIDNAPVLNLQDPFVTYIDGLLYVGGVEVIWDGDNLVDYWTQFYCGTGIFTLKRTFCGPKLMKDIRILQLPDKRIAVFSRPQGQPMLEKYGCIAKIGFGIADSIDMVDDEYIAGLPLIEGQFTNDEWGGCNQLYNLKNGLIGVLGHKSWGKQEGDVFVIHYYSMAFAICPKTRRLTQTKIVSDRSLFPKGPQKNARTADVTFSSGIVRLGNGKCELYSGLNDCQAGKIIIDDPMTEYEEIVL